MENEALSPEIVYGADVTWGNVGKDVVISRFWEVYFNDTMKGPDEVITKISEIKLSEVEDGKINITFTPNEELINEYPNALVVVDGKWFDINILKSPISLNAAAKHRISIVWSQKTLVETFLIEKAV